MAEWICEKCDWKNAGSWTRCAKCGAERYFGDYAQTKAKYKQLIESRLIPDEKLLDLEVDLKLSFEFISTSYVVGEYNPNLDGALALTTNRLIAVWRDLSKAHGWFHIPAILGLVDRAYGGDRTALPYQAMILIPGGVSVIVQSSGDEEQRTHLSWLLINSFTQLPQQNRYQDDIKALRVHEKQQKEQEEKKRLYDD